MPQYQRHLDDALLQLATTLEGQMVVLFTSHAALRSSYAAIKPILEARDILVLGQGVDEGLDADRAEVRRRGDGSQVSVQVGVRRALRPPARDGTAAEDVGLSLEPPR